VSTSGLIENLDQTLDIFADVVRNPTFPAGEVEKFKARTLAQLQFQRSVPQFLAQEHCSTIQGYLIARPTPAPEAFSLVRSLLSVPRLRGSLAK